MRMKSYCMSVIIFCCVVFLGTGCSKELSKEEEFKEFVTSELNGPGKEKKVKKFILEHFSFANEGDLYFEGEYDTNNVCLFIENPEYSYTEYSFRLVKDNSDEGYSEGFKVYCTTGETDEEFDNDFKKLAFFLYNSYNKDKNHKTELYEHFEIKKIINELKERIKVANINLVKRGFKKIDLSSISNRIDHNGFLNLKGGLKSPILDASRHIIRISSDDLSEDDIYVGSIVRYMDENKFNDNLNNYKTDFLEKCEGQQFENCNEPHSTNLFIYYKGTYYGIDQWEKFL